MRERVAYGLGPAIGGQQRIHTLGIRRIPRVETECPGEMRDGHRPRGGSVGGIPICQGNFRVGRILPRRFLEACQIAALPGNGLPALP